MTTSRAAYFREYNKKRRADPAYRARNRQQAAEWREKNPDYARAKGAERRADPAKYEGDKARNRTNMQAKRADPAYRARERARARERCVSWSRNPNPCRSPLGCELDLCCRP